MYNMMLASSDKQHWTSYSWRGCTDAEMLPKTKHQSSFAHLKTALELLFAVCLNRATKRAVSSWLHAVFMLS